MTDYPIVVLVCGSRSWKNPDPIFDRIRELPTGSKVMHGGADGADEFAGNAAITYGLQVKVFKARWKEHGGCKCKSQGPGSTCRYAGYRRNLEMLEENPDLALAFWDGKSRGTHQTITEALQRGIPLEVIGEQA